MYIQLEHDYNANDNKGLYIHISRKNQGEEGTVALIRIENGGLFWYESQNGEFICDSNGEHMTESNIDLVCRFLSKQFPDAEIDKSGITVGNYKPNLGYLITTRSGGTEHKFINDLNEALAYYHENRLLNAVICEAAITGTYRFKRPMPEMITSASCVAALDSGWGFICRLPFNEWDDYVYKQKRLFLSDTDDLPF